MTIRLLTQNDWAIWKALRLEALQDSPESFGSSFEEESKRSYINFQEDLHKNDIFGVFIHGNLVASTGFYPMRLNKKKHRGFIFAVYTKPEHRKKGIANRLIEHVIIHAKSRVIQLDLTCSTNNTAAIKMYQKNGFKICGTEPRSLKIGDQFFDEHLMILDLDA